MRKIALLIIAVCSSVWGTVSSTAQTAHFLVPFTDLGLRSNIVRSVTLTPIARTLDTAGVIRLPDPITYGVGAHPEMTNGSVTFSNRLTGYAMRFDLSTAYSVYSYTSCVPTNVAGLVNATDYGGVIVGMVSGIVNPFAFFNPQLNAQFSNSVAAIVAANIPQGIVTNNSTGVTLSGTFSGNGVGLQLPNSATNSTTNIVTYTMSFTSTNPIDVYAPAVGSEVNGRYFWNAILNRYTNDHLPYFVAYPNDFTGGWYIGTNLSDPDGIANTWYYNGSVSMPIYESSAWTYRGQDDSEVIWIGTIVLTNKNINFQQNSVSFSVPAAGWGTATAFSSQNIFGEQIFSENIFYGGICRFGGRYDYVYPSFDYVPNTSSGTGNDGLQAYAWNLASPIINAGDKRYSIGVGFIHGTNGQNGATFDFLNQFRNGYSTANNSGGFKIYMRLGTRGDITVGDIPYSQHGTEPVANWRFGIYGGNGDGVMPNMGMGSGNLVASPVAGGSEFDGTNWYRTDNTATRKRELVVKTSANNIPTAITVGASPFAYTNATGTPLMFWFYGTNNYSVALNGVTVQSFNGTNGASMILAPTNRVVITYTAAPILNTNLFQF